MGTGRYKNGKFDLILSIRHNADATRIQQWERSFRRASEILFDATEGQMQFGKLFVANNRRGNDEADAWLLQEEGTSSSHVNALGSAGLHMNLKSDEKNKPFIIIHEYGHYGLGLYDEYVGPSGSAECTGNTDDGACIMEFGWTDGDQIDDAGVLTEGAINEFCTEDNHDPDDDTNQEAQHHESCWVTIGDNYNDITVPSNVPSASPIPTGHDAVEWIMLADDPRFALILDRSGSMSAYNAIAGVRYGADYWVNYVSLTGDSLSVVAYNQSQDVILPLTTLTDTLDLSSELATIATINPQGSTNIGGAMNSGVSQITSPGDRAATQVMILFSDGLHNTGTAPETVLSSLIENGIRAYTIGFGPYADQERLHQIADQTGGRFEQIDADPDTPDAQLEIQNYLIEISGEVRDGSGIITMSPGLLPEPSASETVEVTRISGLKFSVRKDIEYIAKLPYVYRSKSTGYDHKAYVEQGSSKATFVVSHKEGTSVNFFLIRPNGDVVNPESDPDVKYVDPPNNPYAFYIITNPTHGYWVMRVTRAQASGEIPFKVFAFSENRDITVGIGGIQQLYNVGDKVHLSTQVYHKIPLTDIRKPLIQVRPTSAVLKRTGIKAASVSMNQRLVYHDHRGVQTKKPIPLRNGVYEGELSFEKPGSYNVLVQVVNQGKGVEALPHAEKPIEGDKVDEFIPAPVFTRTKSFQIHVGPLSKGVNVETLDLPKPIYEIEGNFKVNITSIKKN